MILLLEDDKTISDALSDFLSSESFNALLEAECDLKQIMQLLFQ